MPERPEKKPKIGWEYSKIQRLKFNSISLTGESPVDEENLIRGSPKSDVNGLN